MATPQSTTTPTTVPLADTPGYYITDNGRVYTDRVTTRHRKGGMREVMQTLSANGYRYVRILVNGRPAARYVHRLVATAFLAAPAEGQIVVRHLDGNPANNSPGNLAWGTQAENMADCIAHGNTLKGVKNPNAKLNDRVVLAARILVEEGYGVTEVGNLIGVSRETVRRAVTGEQWGHVDG